MNRFCSGKVLLSLLFSSQRKCTWICFCISIYSWQLAAPPHLPAAFIQDDWVRRNQGVKEASKRRAHSNKRQSDQRLPCTGKQHATFQLRFSRCRDSTSPVICDSSQQRPLQKNRLGRKWWKSCIQLVQVLLTLVI